MLNKSKNKDMKETIYIDQEQSFSDVLYFMLFMFF